MINWKVRLKNGTWLMSMAALIITFVYSVLDMCGVAPEIGEGRVTEIVQSVLTFLGLIGVIADPTTTGLGDSARAMGYDTPWNDNQADGGQNG